VRDLILEPSRAEDLNRVIQEGEYYGMQTFDQSLIRRVDQGLISMDEALKVANNPSDMKLQASSGAAASAVPGI
jgi:twitching motility protein PilT